jgi:hypothetical protein
MFPGPDARVEHAEEPEATPRVSHVKTWRVQIDIFESGDDTTAHATLTAQSPMQVDARGRTHRHEADTAVPEIGDEIAVARALRRLADRLLGVASGDISAVEGRPVSLRG